MKHGSNNIKSTCTIQNDTKYAVSNYVTDIIFNVIENTEYSDVQMEMFVFEHGMCGIRKQEPIAAM